MTKPYRSLFVGELVQESFLSVGGTDDPDAPVDSPFCRDGLGQPTLRGSGLAGALIATLRRALGGGQVPAIISDSDKGRQPSAWRFFNSHQPADFEPSYRQHVAIDKRTGAAADQALFDLETLPPETTWPFLLEVVTERTEEPAKLARKALSHWLAGRCLIGREVAAGLGWMRLKNLREYRLTTEYANNWPCARKAGDYRAYIERTFAAAQAEDITPEKNPLPGWIDLSGHIDVGKRADDFGKGYGIDSLSIGGHASEELAAAWDARHFLAPEGMSIKSAKDNFDPDASVVMFEQDGKRLPYIPGSSLRGPLRHALARLLRAGGKSTDVVERLFGPEEPDRDNPTSAKLLICDALPAKDAAAQLAWFQHHAEDEFAGGVYKSSKFDRVAVTQGRFNWRMVLENGTDEEKGALKELFKLARAGQIGIGGGQWRGHGWLLWHSDNLNKLEGNDG